MTYFSIYCILLVFACMCMYLFTYIHTHILYSLFQETMARASCIYIHKKT